MAPRSTRLSKTRIEENLRGLIIKHKEGELPTTVNPREGDFFCEKCGQHIPTVSGLAPHWKVCYHAKVQIAPAPRGAKPRTGRRTRQPK